MGIGYNGIKNTIFWTCKKCGHSLNQATVLDIEEYFLECDQCGTSHDIKIYLFIQETEALEKRFK